MSETVRGWRCWPRYWRSQKWIGIQPIFLARSQSQLHFLKELGKFWRNYPKTILLGQSIDFICDCPMESTRRTSCATFRSISHLIPGRHKRLNSSYKVTNLKMIFITKSKCSDLVWERHNVVCSITQTVRYFDIKSIRSGNLLIKGVLRVSTLEVIVSAVSSSF